MEQKANQQQQAYNLYLQTEMTQEQIADMLSINRKTLYLWIKQGNWQRVRRSAFYTPSMLADQYYRQLLALNDKIEAREEQPYPTREETDVIRKLTLTIKQIKNRQTLNESLETMTLFMEHLQRDNMELAQKIGPYSISYINSLATKNPIEKALANLTEQYELEQELNNLPATPSENSHSEENTDEVSTDACPEAFREGINACPEAFREGINACPEAFREGNNACPEAFREGINACPEAFREGINACPEAFREGNNACPEAFREGINACPEAFREGINACPEAFREGINGASPTSQPIDPQYTDAPSPEINEQGIGALQEENTNPAPPPPTPIYGWPEYVFSHPIPGDPDVIKRGSITLVKFPSPLCFLSQQERMNIIHNPNPNKMENIPNLWREAPSGHTETYYRRWWDMPWPSRPC